MFPVSPIYLLIGFVIQKTNKQANRKLCGDEMPSGFTVRHYHRVRYCIRIHILYSSLVQSL